jgi:hypothetical protein
MRVIYGRLCTGKCHEPTKCFGGGIGTVDRSRQRVLPMGFDARLRALICRAAIDILWPIQRCPSHCWLQVGFRCGTVLGSRDGGFTRTTVTTAARDNEQNASNVYSFSYCRLRMRSQQNSCCRQLATIQSVASVDGLPSLRFTHLLTRHGLRANELDETSMSCHGP